MNKTEMPDSLFDVLRRQQHGKPEGSYIYGRTARNDAKINANQLGLTREPNKYKSDTTDLVGKDDGDPALRRCNIVFT